MRGERHQAGFLDGACCTEVAVGRNAEGQSSRPRHRLTIRRVYSKDAALGQMHVFCSSDSGSSTYHHTSQFHTPLNPLSRRAPSTPEFHHHQQFVYARLRCPIHKSMLGHTSGHKWAHKQGRKQGRPRNFGTGGMGFGYAGHGFESQGALGQEIMSLMANATSHCSPAPTRALNTAWRCPGCLLTTPGQTDWLMSTVRAWQTCTPQRAAFAS